MGILITIIIVAVVLFAALKALRNTEAEEAPSEPSETKPGENESEDLSPMVKMLLNEEKSKEVYQFSVGGAVSTSYAVDRQMVPTPIQPRRYSPNNRDFHCWEMGFKYCAYLRNDLMKPKDLNVHADSWESLLALVEEIHRFRAKRESNAAYIEAIDGPLPINPVLRFPLAGNEYRRPKAQKMFANMKQGEKVLLVREPSNPHDRNAVMVLAQDGEHIGYVSAGKAKRAGELFTAIGYAWLDRKPDELTGRFFMFEDYLEYNEPGDGYDYPDPETRFTEQEE